IRGLILVPWVTPSILTALMWAWMYNGNYGVINDILFRVGVIGQYVPWLAQSQTALPAIIATLWWQGTPFFAVMLLAGLQSIPAELYEAARVDGASPFQAFWRITLPLLAPIIAITALLR